MKLRNLILALGLAGLMSACDQMPKTAPESAGTETESAAAKDDSPVVAEVNGSAITRKELDVYMKQRQARRPAGEEDEQAVLNELINLELASQQGVQQNLDDELDVALQIEQQRRAVVASAAIQRYLEEHPVTDEEMKKLYDENVGSGDEYKARHILVEEKADAEKVIAELDKGADFSELAKQRSTGPSGNTGGELGWFSPKQMVQPFSDAVAKLEKGGYTKEPVQTQFGWHVIILDDKRQSTPPDFEMLKPQIMAMMQNQRVQQYIESLRETASINIVAEAGEAQAPTQSGEPATDAPAEGTEPATEGTEPATETPAEPEQTEEAPAPGMEQQAE